MLFADAVQSYFSSLDKRELPGIGAMFDDDAQTAVILPGGALVVGYPAIMDLHKEWFSDPDWSMEHEVISMREMGALGLVLAKVCYHDLNEHGEPYTISYYLHLTFCCRDGQWKVVHDQNTLLAR